MSIRDDEEYMNTVNGIQSKRIRELLVLGRKKQKEVASLEEHIEGLNRSNFELLKKLKEKGEEFSPASAHWFKMNRLNAEKLEVANKAIEHLEKRIELLNFSNTELKVELSKIRTALIEKELKKMVGPSFYKSPPPKGCVRPTASDSFEIENPTETEGVDGPRIFTLRAKDDTPPFSVLYKMRCAEMDAKVLLTRAEHDRDDWKAVADRSQGNYEALRATHNALKREIIRAWNEDPNKKGAERLNMMCDDFAKELKHES